MDLKEKILADIKKTGFVTELEVGSILRKHGWSTYQSETFQDMDTGKSREIDIIAIKARNDKESKLYIELNLVIDVKMMKKRPWVIFEVEKEKLFPTPGWGIVHYGYNCLKKNKTSTSIIFRPGDIDKENFKKEKSKYGISFHEAFKDPAEPSKTYDALIGTCKAAWHIKNTRDYSDANKDFDLNESTELYFFNPLVVLDGNLFGVTLNQKGDIELDEEEYIPIRLNYSSGSYKDDITFYPDLIKISYLEEYLTKADKWFNGMFNAFKETILTDYRKKATHNKV